VLTSRACSIFVLAFVSYAGACYSGNLALPLPPDGGAGAPDGAGPDASDASPADAGPSDASDAASHPLPIGPLVPYTSDLIVDAVTSDGQIVYWQNSTLMAVSVAGGAPTSLMPCPNDALPSVFGSTVVLPSCGPYDGAPPSLRTWSRQNGLKTLTTAFAGWAATLDGSTVAYITTTGAQPALIESSADGSNAKTLATGPYVGNTLSFGADGTLFMSTPAQNNYREAVTISVYPATGIPWTTPTGVSWVASPDGQWLLDFALDGSLQIRKTLGGTPTTLATTGVSPSDGALFDPGSKEVVYWKDGALQLLTLATGTVSTLGVPPCSASLPFARLSPDGRYLVCDPGGPSSGPNAPGPLVVDLKTGATKASPPSTYLSAFTSDSSYALLIKYVPGSTNGLGNALYALPLAGTSTTPTLSISPGVSVAFALLPPPFLLVDAIGGPVDPVGTLSVNDLTGQSPTKTLATSVLSMAESPDGAFVAYVATTGPEGAGLLVAPTP
jgi:hypothetical protein